MGPKTPGACRRAEAQQEPALAGTALLLGGPRRLLQNSSRKGRSFPSKGFTSTIRYLLYLSRRSNPHTDVTFLEFHQQIRQAVSGKRTLQPESSERAGVGGPFPLRFLSCTLSLCCLRNADKSIHQKISSVKLNQERSCQRERNRLNQHQIRHGK